MKKLQRMTALILCAMLGSSCFAVKSAAASRQYAAGMTLRAASGPMTEEGSTVNISLQIKGKELAGSAGLVLWYRSDVLEPVEDSAVLDEHWSEIPGVPAVSRIGDSCLSILAAPKDKVTHGELTDVVTFRMKILDSSRLGPDILAIAGPKHSDAFRHAAVMSFDYRVVVSDRDAPDGLSAIVPELKYLVNASLSMAAEQAGFAVKTVTTASDVGGDSGGSDGQPDDGEGDEPEPPSPAPEKTEIQVSGVKEETKAEEIKQDLKEALEEIANQDQPDGSTQEVNHGLRVVRPESEKTDPDEEDIVVDDNAPIGTGCKVQLIAQDENGEVIVDEGGKPVVLEEVVIVVKGDIGGDGVIDDDDAMAALAHSANYSPVAESYQENACDFNGDGHVSFEDALNILRYSGQKEGNG